jgi:hypothetical protein
MALPLTASPPKQRAARRKIHNSHQEPELQQAAAHYEDP